MNPVRVSRIVPGSSNIHDSGKVKFLPGRPVGRVVTLIFNTAIDMALSKFCNFNLSGNVHHKMGKLVWIINLAKCLKYRQVHATDSFFRSKEHSFTCTKVEYLETNWFCLFILVSISPLKYRF